MLTNFDIAQPNKKLNIDMENAKRLLKMQKYRALYVGDFALAFPATITKLTKKYPLENTTAQTLVEINMFNALTEFFKFLMTNAGIDISVVDSNQPRWDLIAEETNFLAVLKEVFVDNSRFGNGLFKVVLNEGKPEIFSVAPDCWFPVFEKGNLNALQGHILIYDYEEIIEGKKIQYKRIEKIYKGVTENELWECKNGVIKSQVDLSVLGVDENGEPLVKEYDYYSDKWNDFILFPVKNTTESDCYYGTSDYERCISIVEDLMLTISQNSKIINRHANPKLAGSEQNLELNTETGKREFPNRDFIGVGKDGVKPEYISVDLQAEAIKQHIDTLMQFYYIMTKTPPQAYGLDIAGNMSGESLKQIFMTALAKADDIRQVSFDSTIKKVVACAMAFNGTPVTEVGINWGNPIPETYSEKVQNENARVQAGTESKQTAIMKLDNVTEEQAKAELELINEDKKADSAIALDNLFPSEGEDDNNVNAEE